MAHKAAIKTAPAAISLMRFACSLFWGAIRSTSLSTAELTTSSAITSPMHIMITSQSLLLILKDAPSAIAAIAAAR